MTSSIASALPTRLRPDFDRDSARLYLGHWPLVIIDIGDAKGDTYRALFDAVDERVIARREPYVMVTDTRRVTQTPGADVRKTMSEWMKKNAAGHTSLGAVTIVKSPLVRGALTALYWLFEPPNPQGVAADWTEAHTWALGKFDSARVPLRPSVREARVQPY